jgi:hypothetical protein
MKKLIKQANILGSHVAVSAAYAGVLTALFLFVGIGTAHAEAYVVDASNGTGECTAFCQQLQAYLNGGATSNSAATGYTSGNPYFAPVVPQGTTPAYGTPSYGTPSYGAPTYGAPAYNNGYNQNGAQGGQGQAPDTSAYTNRIYTYYQNPNPTGVGANAPIAQPNGGYVAPATPSYSSYGNAGYNQPSYNQPSYNQPTYGQPSYNQANPYGSAYDASAQYAAPRMYVTYGSKGSSTGTKPAATTSAKAGTGFRRTSGF